MVAKQLPDEGQFRNHVWADSMVALVNHGQAKLQIEAETSRFSGVLYPGSLVTIPAGFTVRSLSWTGSHEQTIVIFAPDKLKGFNLQMGGTPMVRPAARFGFSDLELEGILRTMRLEIESGCPSGALFGESMSLALFARLASGVWKSPREVTNLRATLSPSQQQRVREFIAANLSTDVGLPDLAELIDASPGHFARLFRNTFGKPPYRYIIEQRIAEAKRIMGTGRQSILEIALLLGFSSQSHFTVTFRKVTGTTPKQFLGKL
jgi:AraC family transcriptional regulator